MPPESSLSDPKEPEDEDVELVTIPDEFGTVVIGTDQELEEFAQRWERAEGGGSVVGLAAPDIQKLVHLAPELINTAKTARYVFGPSLWMQAKDPAPGTIVTYHRMTRSASSGKILANPRIGAPPVAAAGAAAPPVAAALIAMEVALDQLAERIEARLDVIEDKVDELLRFATAQRLGDVHGSLRLLKRKLSEVNEGHQLTATEWSTIAHLGTDLERDVERLRQHAMQLLSTLCVDDPATKRADKLKSIVEKGRMCETLQLLLMAQQSLYIWQRLRLERVVSAEPDFVAQTTASARTTLREQFDADNDLAARLRNTLDNYAALRVNEVHHQLAARTMTRYRAPLAEMVDKFIEIRGLQVDGWLGVQHAGFRDAVNAVASKTAEITRVSRKQLAKWIDPDGGSEGDS